MLAHPLDNPIWSSLTTEQKSLAIGSELALRYPPEIAPFVAIASDDGRAADRALDLVSSGEMLYFVGVAPSNLRGWLVLKQSRILQMMWDGATALKTSSDSIVELTPNDAPAMVELTSLAFPGFFRRRTHELGRYCGIKADGLLVSMAGERMHAAGFREISAVCTHPNHVGRGHAAQLSASLIHSMRDQGIQPFLHVSSDNHRAQALYRRLGFSTRAELRLCQVQRG